MKKRKTWDRSDSMALESVCRRRRRRRRCVVQLLCIFSLSSVNCQLYSPPYPYCDESPETGDGNCFPHYSKECKDPNYLDRMPFLRDLSSKWVVHKLNPINWVRTNDVPFFCRNSETSISVACMEIWEKEEKLRLASALKMLPERWEDCTQRSKLKHMDFSHGKGTHNNRI